MGFITMKNPPFLGGRFERAANPSMAIQQIQVMYSQFYISLRILTPPMETPDPPNDAPGALKQVVLTPHDIPWSLRVG